MFETIKAAPPDSILGLTEAWKSDPNPLKINLGVGVYKDDEGVTPILLCVKAAERRIAATATTKSYMPIAGAPEYGKAVQEMILGADHAIVREGRARTAHTPGGTAALRVGADFLKRFMPNARAWLSAPTWANHPGIFTAAGFKVESYPYYNAATRGLEFDKMLAQLERVGEGDVVVLHACCHNPTGVDLSAEQWKALAAAAAAKRWIPFLDFAYQGYGAGLEADRAGLLALCETCPELLVASSFSKNFGLYQDRVGALTLIARNAEEADAAFSNIETTIRVNYSNPPAHGGLIVTTILADAALRKQWTEELDEMRDRIAGLRVWFVESLRKHRVPGDFSFIAKQRGMFSFSGLTDAQVKYLREKKSIYIVGGGRINVAGITSRNMDYLCTSIAEAVKAAPG